jgi:hypothetical protein
MGTAGRSGIRAAALLAAAGCESGPATPAEPADGVSGGQVRALDHARAVEALGEERSERLEQAEVGRPGAANED